MELSQLQSFLVVAEEENLAAAAGRLNISVAALGLQIESLEKELGWDLFERGANSVGLTRAGKVVAWEGRKLMRQVELARERMARQIEGDILRVGYAPSLAHEFLAVAMERFMERHPGHRVELADAAREEMMHALRDGSMHLVVEVAGDDPGVDWISLVQHEWHLAVPSSHAFAQADAVSVAELDGERLLLYSKAEYPGHWRHVMGYFDAYGVNAMVAGEFDGRAGLMTALEAGMGVSLVLSGNQIEKQTGGSVLAKPLVPPMDLLCVGVGLPAGRIPGFAVAEFVEDLKAASADGGLRGGEDRR